MIYISNTIWYTYYKSSNKTVFAKYYISQYTKHIKYKKIQLIIKSNNIWRPSKFHKRHNVPIPFLYSVFTVKNTRGTSNNFAINVSTVFHIKCPRKRKYIVFVVFVHPSISFIIHRNANLMELNDIENWIMAWECN